VKPYDAKLRSIENSLAYLHGRLEAQIEAFATALGIPAIELTARMWHVLSSPPGRTILGSIDRMPDLRNPPAQGTALSRPLALDDRSRKLAARPDPSLKPKTPKKQQNNYWSKLTAAERQKEMRRRIKKRQKNQQEYAARLRGQPLPGQSSTGTT
jgi:hypothetical protein